MVLTAVLSFYLEASVVSAKRDEQSQRLRRFHLGLDKMEQTIRRGRIVRVGSRLVTLMRLSETPELNGFPNYQPEPVQFASTREGVIMISGSEDKMILPLMEDETVIFGWLQYNPPSSSSGEILRIALHRYGNGERSNLLFARTISLMKY